MTNVEERLISLEHRIDALAEVIHMLSASVPPPQFNQSGRYFRYDTPSAIHYCLLKGARVVSGLYACTALSRSGFSQEICVLLRTVVEYCSQIDYVASSMDEAQRPIGKAADAIRDFFEDHYESRSSNTKRLKLRQQDVHEHIGNSIDEVLDVKSRDVPLSKLMSNVYLNLSNYVHGRHVECMDMYGGRPGHFHLFGMSGTPKDRENLEILTTYLTSAENSFMGVMQAFQLFSLFSDNPQVQAWYDGILERSRD